MALLTPFLSLSVKCGELQSAADSFERALEIAEELKDSSAQAAIKKALEEVNDRIVQGVQDDDKDRPEGDNDDDGRRSVTSHKSDKSAGKGTRGFVRVCKFLYYAFRVSLVEIRWTKVVCCWGRVEE